MTNARSSISAPANLDAVPRPRAGRRRPDANSIWRFREALTKSGVVERLFEVFDRKLRTPGYPASWRTQAIKEGRVPEG